MPINVKLNRELHYIVGLDNWRLTQAYVFWPTAARSQAHLNSTIVTLPCVAPLRGRLSSSQPLHRLHLIPTFTSSPAVIPFSTRNQPLLRDGHAFGDGLRGVAFCDGDDVQARGWFGLAARVTYRGGSAG